MKSSYNYKETLETAEKIGAWRVEDIISGDRRPDFNRPFLPESVARVEPMDFLSRAEKLALNQIRGYGYLYTVGLVEEFILPFILDHARPKKGGHGAPEPRPHNVFFYDRDLKTGCPVYEPNCRSHEGFLAHQNALKFG